MKKLNTIIDLKKASLDKNGIWVTDIKLGKDVSISKEAWENIYNFNLDELRKDKKDFIDNKLKDHISYIKDTYKFNEKTIYLEIGCGPAHIGEYLMEKHDVTFVGVDFNYPMLLSLQAHLKEKGFKKYILIHSDITKMPILGDSIDYIYGGGVIEHMSDTLGILKELRRVLRKDGVVFNTIPAFNLFWLSRFYNNIPYNPILKSFFEYVHIKILKGEILKKYYGYELSYTLKQLYKLHRSLKFQNITQKPFAFYPSEKKVKNKLLRRLCYKISLNSFTSPVYCVYAKK
ncbi:MAG: class I SAM-dependent methyltransferase [Candidatus Moraniibacteriota bacterium]|nr:MAG: class I SAM-dependent methyltransferase [Candidatus Moranbacteria bacterium]